MMLKISRINGVNSLFTVLALKSTDIPYPPCSALKAKAYFETTMKRTTQ